LFFYQRAIKRCAFPLKLFFFFLPFGHVGNVSNRAGSLFRSCRASDFPKVRSIIRAAAAANVVVYTVKRRRLPLVFFFYRKGVLKTLLANKRRKNKRLPSFEYLNVYFRKRGPELKKTAGVHPFLFSSLIISVAHEMKP
jgi:hypothetical protein